MHLANKIKLHKALSEGSSARAARLATDKTRFSKGPIDSSELWRSYAELRHLRNEVRQLEKNAGR